ncbi:MAG TPA: glucose 1-dehydrogenase [Phycisphaerales bacterium]|nr:glucose 1-dehydrogenase [Phycisphaerales bacterium]
MAVTYSGFKGKVALVTGGTSGIGKTAALALAKQGAHVVLTGRRAAEGEAVAGAVSALGVKGVFVQGDVTSEGHIVEAVKTAVNLGGASGLSFAFNNAGIELGGVSIAESTVEQYRQVFDVNVLGVLLSMKHQLRAMLANDGGKGRGSIVNTSSVAGRVGMANTGVYIASKHAVNGLTKTAALEVAKNNIRVNTVSPAAIDTEMLDRFTGGKSPDAMAWMQSVHPVGRIGTPGEIADPVLFLLSDASSFITGADLLVDGGYTVP